MQPRMRLALMLLAAIWPGAGAAAIPVAPATEFHAYVRGRLAQAGDDLKTAGSSFGIALRSASDGQLMRRAFDVALAGGDRQTVERLANQIAVGSKAEEPGDSLLLLSRMVLAASKGDWRRYDAARQAFHEPVGNAESQPLLGPILAAYGHSARGQHDAALAELKLDSATGMARSYFVEHRAHLLALAKRWPEAAESYAEILAAEGANVPRLRVAAAGAALEAGASDPAWRNRAILLLGEGGRQDPLLDAARKRLLDKPGVSGRDLGAMIGSPAEGIAMLLLRIATDVGRENPGGAALSFARLATIAAPNLPESWIVTSDFLAQAERRELALQALEQVPSRAPWQDIARTRRGAILADAERYDEALAILAPKAAAATATPDDWGRVAEVQRRAGNHRAAAESMAKALALAGDASEAMRGQLHFLHAVALEQAGDFDAAEPEFRHALALAPDNPIVLNYLGYSLLDRGLKVEEARQLIARAYEAMPDNGAIIDSMGWAAYLAGDYDEAARLLERAHAAEPADPTVADHLGDALWRSGRRIEARNAWFAASALDPSDTLNRQLAHKLKFGLDVALNGALARR